MLARVPAISVRHLSHRFGPHQVLTDISFDVAAGEVFGFIGPNGAGKTTTIRAMATLLDASAGTILIDGVDVALEPELVRRKMGYMADQSGVYPKLTVGEYLAFFAACHGLRPRGPVDAVLATTALEAVRGELCGNLSKGMRQRLQLARTLLHEPDVLILDEPASDLDPHARIAMRDLFLDLSRRGKTVFLSSHILTELSDVCTSVAILDHGRLVAAGPVQSIAQRMAGASGGAAPSAGAPGTPPQHRGVKIRTLGQGDRAAWLLQTMPEVATARALGDVVSVVLRGDEEVLAETVRRLVLSEIRVVGVEPERNELEALFLGVTHREAP